MPTKCVKLNASNNFPISVKLLIDKFPRALKLDLLIIVINLIILLKIIILRLLIIVVVVVIIKMIMLTHVY